MLVAPFPHPGRLSCLCNCALSLLVIRRRIFAARFLTLSDSAQCLFQQPKSLVPQGPTAASKEGGVDVRSVSMPLSSPLLSSPLTCEYALPGRLQLKILCDEVGPGGRPLSSDSMMGREGFLRTEPLVGSITNHLSATAKYGVPQVTPRNLVNALQPPP